MPAEEVSGLQKVLVHQRPKGFLLGGEKVQREKKTVTIDQLEVLFRKCRIGIVADYRGITAVELTTLRRRFREKGLDFKVVKNTLAHIAAEKAGREDLTEIFKGPVAIIFGYQDEIEPAKALSNFNRDLKTALEVRGGFLTDRLLGAGEVTSLAKLPPKEVLIGQVIGGMQAPIYRLVSQLSAPIRGIAGVLGARINQLEAK
ncbi:MAG: 50S ribosomal protein L10 [Dehalococcoidia bacterium]|nr:MAG: 50S ribosomal protein L10 [Dehalococcoidia bacterium]